MRLFIYLGAEIIYFIGLYYAFRHEDSLASAAFGAATFLLVSVNFKIEDKK